MTYKFQDISHPHPHIPEVTPNEVAENVDKLCIVDVRTPEEYSGELGHIDNSQLIPIDELSDSFDLLPKNETLVFVCRSGARSAHATQYAKSRGLHDCYNLKGGMLLWNQLGLKRE